MGRTSKGAHVLAKLRQELGLHQKEMAERVGLHWRTIQNIEGGKSKLNRRTAMRISQKTGVSVHWLLQNDSDREIVNASGKKWSHKDQQAFDARSKQWPGLSRNVRWLELAVSAPLFRDYLTIRALLEGAPNPLEASLKWHKCQKQALFSFASSYEPLRAEKGSLLTKKWLGKEGIQEIRNDLDAISEDLQSPADEESLELLLMALSRVGARNLGDILTAFDQLSETPQMLEKLRTPCRRPRPF
jgi:transcriptional regulator with XRE-family HTH domain